MASQHNLYTCNYKGKVTNKLSFCGYAYTRNKVFSGKKGDTWYFICDQRNICKAQYTRNPDGTWKQGKEHWTKREFWNVYTRVLDGVPRTSNFVEGFHNKWNGALGLRRPPMWRFMLLMCKFQQNTETSLNKIEAGGPPRLQRRLQRLRNHRLVETCSLYSSRFKTVKFKNWITRITLHVPDFN